MANIRKFPDAGLPLGYSIQPGSELIYHDTGLIEGTVVIKATDQNRENRLREMVGTRHPKDSDVFLYAMRDRALTLDVDEGTFDCIGTVDGEDTARIVVPDGVHCRDANGQMDIAALAILADTALATATRLLTTPGARLATVRMQMQFTGEPVT